ncbi:MAG: hypothetical protein A2902_02995 [Elusimicrobia bacterium RIFCSPLOWO2_01_FULL_64_13]|nr:MAG: hypothetical protein A2902_02995 [Elusimicrobia bacterium RIFCSPLOWO2_01_FULL_64_13]
MKCPSCSADNKDTALHCKKCGGSLIVMWSPSIQWHARTLGVIIAGLVVFYFLANWMLKPYLREIPPEVTPWLKKSQNIHQ